MIMKYRSPVPNWIKPGIQATLANRNVVNVVTVSEANLGWVYVRDEAGSRVRLVLASELSPIRDATRNQKPGNRI